MIVPERIKAGHKILGYFAYTQTSQVFCDGDACVLAGSIALMKSYLQKDSTAMPGDDYLIKKTRFSEVMEGLRRRGAYAFDEIAYRQFLSLAHSNHIEGLPSMDSFTEVSAPLHFLRIQMLD